MENQRGTKESKVFNDPIHGHIELHPVLVKIINTPEFQRLRNIKQLGGVYFVYPGASHNRFEHSIGVAHLAGELAKALKVKQLEQIKPLEELKELKELKKLTPEELENLKKLQNLNPQDLKELQELTPDKLGKLKKLRNSKPEDLEKLKPEELDDLKKLVELENLDCEKLEKLKKLQNSKSEGLKLNPEDSEMLQKFKPKDVEKLEKLKSLDELKKSLISEQDVLCVQIAGLCHDLGHGPFSHLFDRMFMPEADKDVNRKWEHEDASIDMLDRLLKQENGLKEMIKEYGLKIEKREIDRMFIEELIKGRRKKESDQDEKSQEKEPDQDEKSQEKEPDQDKWPYEGRKKEKSFLYEIVSNKKTGIDVDKFDYFARDCHHLGIQNNFDHKRFIMFARVCDVEEEEEEDGSKKKKKIKHICSRDKEVANLYDIFQQRHSIHRRACKHKIALAVEIMIKDALILADLAEHKAPELQIKGSNDKTYCLCKAKEDMEAYIKLTDQVIERILYFPPSFLEGRNVDSTESTSKEGRKEGSTESTSKEGRKEDSTESTSKEGRKEGSTKSMSKEGSKEDSTKATFKKEREDARKILEKSRKILHRVMNRDLYFCVGQAMKKDQVDISKEMEESLKTMITEIPDDGEDGFVIILVTLDYGMENVDPISKAYFYRKDNPDKGFPISKSKVSKFLPEHFSEDKFMVFWKNHDGLQGKQREEREKNIRKCFKDWCEQNGFEDAEDDHNPASPETPGNDQSS